MSDSVVKVQSPNFTDEEIPVQFLILHYTAVSGARTLEIFQDEQSNVSSHLVIDSDGTVYELVPCLDGIAQKAWHAGKSKLLFNGAELESFNSISIGIELVNANGNVFPYPKEQFEGLIAVVERLQEHYPLLKEPERILGHEQIAGFRGKADPGHCFPWDKFFQQLFPDETPPERLAIVPADLLSELKKQCEALPENQRERDEKSAAISLELEQEMKRRMSEKV